MFNLKDGGTYRLDGQITNLTKEQIHKFCIKKCKRHKVDYDYCLKRMLAMEHKSIKDFIKNMEELLYWAFFHDYNGLFAFRRKSK